jgi:uncharacterized protein with HEPN domain
MKNDLDYLGHILECLEWIQRFAAEGREAFFRDRKTQAAVLRELQTLAESTQRLSNSLKNQHPEIPWSNIAGFRNVLVHDYLGINFERVWEIMERDLPHLQAAIKAMRREADNK